MRRTKKSITLPATALLAMVSFSTSQPATAAPEAELIHHYTLDGTLADEVSALVLQSGPDSPVHYVEDAPSGRAKSVLFGSDTDRANGRLIFPMAVKLPSAAGTISMWVKAPAYTAPPAGARYLLNVPGQEYLGYEPGKPSGCYITLSGLEGSIGCTLGGGETLRGGFSDLSDWIHLAVTWSDDRKSARLYLNGNQAAESEILHGPLQSEVHPIRIGGFATTPDIDPTETQFQGMLSDLRIYEGELSEAEIAKLAMSATPAAARSTAFKPARIFSSHMVLQRDHPVPVWGSGPDGATIEVDFAGQKKSATVADGRWEIVLDPLPVSAEGRPMVLTTGERKITLDDILVGDVWLASGQSNMQMALGSTVGGKEAVAESADPLLRFFITPMKLGPEAPSLPAEWQVSAPGKTGGLTAVGYHFARELRKATGIPIGVVQSAYGGSRAESWSSPELISRGWPGYDNFFKNQKPEHFEKHPQVLASACYESMLRPLIPFAFRGTIWYQGEGNSGTPEEHKKLLPALIEEFRQQFRRAGMPFYFVQLARLERADWSQIRRAQLHIWENTPDTFMAVTIDLPKTFNENDDGIHPNVKQPIGERLARAARHFIYGEHDLLPAGPRFKDALPWEGKTVLSFDYAGAGLSTLDGQPLRGLYAGPLGGPLKAVDAVVQDDKLVIDHAANGLSLPLLIRYGSEEDMGKETLDVNLGNSETLPASPFMARVSAE